MTNRSILVLGAPRYNLKGIQSLRSAGFKVVAVDRDKNAAGFLEADVSHVCDIRDAEGVLQIAADEKVDGILPINDFGVLTAAKVSSALGLPGNPVDVALKTVSKAEMRQEWLRQGVPCPRFMVVHEKEALDQAVEEIGFPVVLKPAYGMGGGSRGISVVKDGSELESAWLFARDYDERGSVIIEAFIDSQSEHSAEVIIIDGEPEVIVLSNRVKADLPSYRVDRDIIYPSEVKGEKLRSLCSVIKESVHALGMVIGAAHVEVAWTRDGPVLFELGARCGGGGTPDPIVPYVTGVDLIVEVARLLTGEPSVLVRPDPKNTCYYRFIIARPGRIKNIKGIKQINDVPGVLDAYIRVAPGDKVPAVRMGPDRAGFIISGAETRAGALAIADKAESLIGFEYFD